MTADSHTPRPRAALALALLAGLSLAAAPAIAQDEEASDPPVEKSEKKEKKKDKRAIKGQKQLAKLLEGRVAGEPVSCIRTLPTNQMTTINKTAYVFGRGNVIYVQRTMDPDDIDDRDALVMQRFGNPTQLCRQDLASTVDPYLGFFTGAVRFDNFVPYTRVKQDES